jgi:glycosyltransferase involved in cell wall biosynthesis
MRVGTICYATCQGLGYLAKDFFDEGIITDVMVYKHPGGTAPSHMEWYPEGTYQWEKKPFKGEVLERWLDDIDVVLSFETPFDWGFPKRCKERGIKTAIMPMYEWFLVHPPFQYDLFLNPSLLDQEYFPQGVFIPVPVRKQWRQRTHALRWLHNAGNIGCRQHKGTVELLKAMKYVKSPIELTVRTQFKRGLDAIIKETNTARDKRITFVTEEIPYEQLYADHDVVVSPEKFNGLSLPLQEAFASGLMVVTTNRFPTNTWLPTKPLIPVSRTQRAQTMAGHLMFDECIVDPRDIAATIDHLYATDITDISLQGKAYADANSWEVLKPRYLAALESIL